MSDAITDTNRDTRETIVVQAEGRRRYRKRAGGLCANRCGNEHAPNDGYCRPCRAALNRKWRADRTKQFHEMKKALEGKT